jgi:hypothetical protein
MAQMLVMSLVHEAIHIVLVRVRGEVSPGFMVRRPKALA